MQEGLDYFQDQRVEFQIWSFFFKAKKNKKTTSKT